MLLSMLVSSQQKFLFVHIPKSAGTSVTAALKSFSDKPEEVWINRLLAKIGINVNWVGPISLGSRTKTLHCPTDAGDVFEFGI